MFGSIYHKTKEYFIVGVPNKSEKTLIPIINQYIIHGSIAFSDSWKSNANLQQQKSRGTDRKFLDSYIAKFM